MTFSTGLILAEAAAGSGISYFYRLNSVYDPDSSGVGTVAGGYSTWSSLFLNYKVRRVTARIHGTCTNSTGCFTSVVIAPVASQAVVPSNPHYWRTIPMMRQYDVVHAGDGGKNTFNHTAAYDNATVARVTPQQYDVDMDFSGQVGSNPARMNYLMLGVQGIGSGTVSTLRCVIQITYEVEWFNPVPMQL